MERFECNELFDDLMGVFGWRRIGGDGWVQEEHIRPKGIRISESEMLEIERPHLDKLDEIYRRRFEFERTRSDHESEQDPELIDRVCELERGFHNVLSGVEQLNARLDSFELASKHWKATAKSVTRIGALLDRIRNAFFEDSMSNARRDAAAGITGPNISSNIDYESVSSCRCQRGDSE